MLLEMYANSFEMMTSCLYDKNARSEGVNKLVSEWMTERFTRSLALPGHSLGGKQVSSYVSEDKKKNKMNESVQRSELSI